MLSADLSAGGTTVDGTTVIAAVDGGIDIVVGPTIDRQLASDRIFGVALGDLAGQAPSMKQQIQAVPREIVQMFAKLIVPPTVRLRQEQFGWVRDRGNNVSDIQSK